MEIHTLELERYHVREQDLQTASLLDCWLYWLIHAHEYEPVELLMLFPQAAIQQATQSITRIADVTEDKAMYDSREKAIRDHQWALNASRREGLEEGEIKGEIRGELKGEIKGEISKIQMLQEILHIPLSNGLDFQGKSLEELRQITAELQSEVRLRTS